MGAAGDATPYPALAELRASAPIHVGMPDLGLVDQDPDNPMFTAYTYETVRTVLGDPETYSSAGYAAIMGAVLGRTILEMDPPEHTRLPLDPAAGLHQGGHAAVGDRAGRAARRPHDRRLRRRRSHRSRAQPAVRLPGARDRRAARPAPRRTSPSSTAWPCRSSASPSTWTGRRPRRGRCARCSTPILAERRAEPRDDMISLLAMAEHDGQRLTDEEIFSFCRLLLPAGAETTYRSSSNLLYGLLTQPDQLDAVRADRSLLRRRRRGGHPLGAAAAGHHPGRHPGHRARPARRSPRAPPSCASSARPTGTRAAGPTRRRSTSTASASRTSASPTARTCASACTWPGWRPRWR